MRYTLRFTNKAQKDINSLSPKLKNKAKETLRNKIAYEPLAGKPLIASLKGYYSVRLSYQDRIVYRVEEEQYVALIVRAKTHYGE